MLHNNFEESMSSVTDDLISYLINTQQHSAKNLSEMFEKIHNRLLIVKDLNKDVLDARKLELTKSHELSNDVKEIELAKIDSAKTLLSTLEQQINHVIENPDILSVFVEKYEKWHPEYPTQETVDQFKKEFLDYFFTPIAKTNAWKNFANETNLTSHQQDLIAGALLFKIHSRTMVTGKFAAEQLSQKEKITLFGLLMGHKWNDNALKDLQTIIDDKIKIYINGKFDGLVPMLLENLNYENFETEIKKAIANIKNYVFISSNSKSEIKKIIEEKLSDLEKQIEDTTTKARPKGLTSKEKEKAITHLHAAWREALKNINPMIEKGLFKSPAPSERGRVVIKEVKEEKEKRTLSPGKKH